MKLENDYRKLRENWYSWTVKIEGSVSELNNIEQVTYILHETFPNNRLVSKDSTNQFAMTFQGWGEFLIKAEIILKDKTRNFAELWLNLGFPSTKDEKATFTGEIS